jgi:signal transduction histidine kinase
MLLTIYVGVFGASALACFAMVPRARRIVDPDTRRGIVWLLLASGGWASAHVGFLLAPSPQVKTAFYVAGLVVGLAAVGPWLYFCSAYTGRSLHRNRRIRQVAVAAFLVVVLVKVTNPLHHRYFTTEQVTEPFLHLAVHSGVLHWLAMGLSYALATVGYFMLLELFVQVSYDTKPFAALIAVTGLPIVLDVVGLQSRYLVDITYEPIGVAVFAVGVFSVYTDRFQAIQLAAERDDAVIVLDDAGRIRDYNDSAATLFPELTADSAIGEPPGAVIPAVADALQTNTDVLAVEQQDAPRYYRLTQNPFGADQTQLGRLVTLTDVTDREQYRRRLERQNQRLETFASMVSHDLRNPLNVAMGRLDLAREDCESEHLAVVATAHARMQELIVDLLQLARQGQPIGETTVVELSSLAGRSWSVVSAPGAELVVERDLAFEADADRLRQLLENLFRNAIEHGGPDVAVRAGALDGGAGFYVADDGPGIPEADREIVFETGVTSDEDGTGFGLAIVTEIAEAHGWDVTITSSAGGGARFEVSGVEPAG